MLKISAIAFRSFAAFSILTGAAYPAIITTLSRGIFPAAADGSLIRQDGKIIGSVLIAQKFTSPRYFHPRPSASDYATLPSGASNHGATSAPLAASVAERRRAYHGAVPPELLFASGSGLDPHLSPNAAIFQINRVIAARALGEEARRGVEDLVATLTEPPTLGIFGRSRVNVLILNMELDRRFP